MSLAWETTEEDVKNVLRLHGIEVSDKTLSELHSNLDHDEIEHAVLACDDFDDQVQAMMDEIKRQLIIEKVIGVDKG